MTMQAEHRVVATSAWVLRTGRGNTYRGVTTTGWESEVATPDRGSVSDIEIRRGDAGRVSICARVRTREIPRQRVRDRR